MIQAILIERLKAMLAFVADESNYYAFFGKVIETCAAASEINRICFAAELIEDEEFRQASEILAYCRSKAIAVHRDWTIQSLDNSKTQHSCKSIVMSVYNDIF